MPFFSCVSLVLWSKKRRSRLRSSFSCMILIGLARNVTCQLVSIIYVLFPQYTHRFLYSGTSGTRTAYTVSLFLGWWLFLIILKICNRLTPFLNRLTFVIHRAAPCHLYGVRVERTAINRGKHRLVLKGCLCKRREEDIFPPKIEGEINLWRCRQLGHHTR